MTRFLPPASSAPPTVSVVVVSYETREDTLACIRSLDREVALPMELLVVDNASGDGTAEAVRRAAPEAIVLANDRNVGFAAACNQAIRRSRGTYVLLLNPDAEVGAGAVESLVSSLAERADAAVAGPRTLSSDGTLQVSFGPDLTPLGEWRQRRLVRAVRRRDPRALARLRDRAGARHEPSWVSGSCLLLRRDAALAVGLLDEGFFLYEEDVDLCLRLRRAGWRVLFEPSATVVHRLGRSMEQSPDRASLSYHRSHLRFYRKHNGRLATAALRSWLLGRAAAAWLLSLGPGPTLHAARRSACDLFHVALRPSNSL